MRFPQGGRIVGACVIAAAVAAPSVAQAGPIRSRLAAAGLLPERAAFTELSIKQFDPLYKTVSFGGDVSFEVVVTNAADTAHRYSWAATVGPDGNPISVGSGEITVPGRTSYEVPLRFRIRDCSQRNKISVRVSTKGERSPEVHYWVLPHGSPEWKLSGGPSCGA